jgi:hypothetical protein
VKVVWVLKLSIAAKEFKRASVGKEIVLLFVFNRSPITNLGGDVDGGENEVAFMS